MFAFDLEKSEGTRLAENDCDNREKILWNNVSGKMGATPHPKQILCGLCRTLKRTSVLSEDPSKRAWIEDCIGGRR